MHKVFIRKTICKIKGIMTEVLEADLDYACFFLASYLPFTRTCHLRKFTKNSKNICSYRQTLIQWWDRTLFLLD